MRSLIKFGNNRRHEFPLFPQLFDDFLTREIFNAPLNHSNFENTIPAVNVKETDAAYNLELAVPGMNKEDFKVNIENNVLTISAQRENKTEEKTDDGKYSRREFSYQSFKRAFSLPENSVEADNITASYKDGILYLSLPKKEAVKATVKEVKVD